MERLAQIEEEQRKNGETARTRVSRCVFFFFFTELHSSVMKPAAPDELEEAETEAHFLYSSWCSPLKLPTAEALLDFLKRGPLLVPLRISTRRTRKWSLSLRHFPSPV